MGGVRRKEAGVSETVGKARVWLLALVAAALVVDGSAPLGEAPASSFDESAELDAPGVALLLSGVNPSLSEPELLAQKRRASPKTRVKGRRFYKRSAFVGEREPLAATRQEDKLLVVGRQGLRLAVRRRC